MPPITPLPTTQRKPRRLSRSCKRPRPLLPPLPLRDSHPDILHRRQHRHAHIIRILPRQHPLALGSSLLQRRDLVPQHQHRHHGHDLRGREMAAGTERGAAAESAERGGVQLRGVVISASRVLYFQEAAGVKDCEGEAPDGRVSVDDGAGHLHDGVLLQEVAVREEGVLRDVADGDAVRGDAEDFLEGGEEEGTRGFEFHDVDRSGGCIATGVVLGMQDVAHFFADVF